MIISNFRPKQIDNLARYGSRNDGGYLIPNDLKFDLLISFGLGDDWNFEKDLKTKGKISNFIVFDHSVSYSQLSRKVIRSGKKVLDDPMNFVYRSRILIRYILTFFGNRHLRLKVVKQAENSGEISALEILETHTKSISSCLLKVDIEGGEWQILDDIALFEHKIDVLIIEFHNINSHLNEYLEFRDRIESSHSLIHIHANNFSLIGSKGIPDVLEATYVKNSLIPITIQRDTLPIEELDAPCAPKKPDYFWDFNEDSVYLKK
jgi:hypothetical protein